MKKLKQFFAIAIFAIALGLGACKDDTPAPTPFAPVFEKMAIPLNDSASFETNITLKWVASDQNNDPLTYTLKLGVEKDELKEKASDLKEATYILRDLAPNNYYWQVIANDGNNGITESPVWNFKIIELFAPIFEREAIPANDSVTFETDITLKWVASDQNNDPLTYTLKIGSDRDKLEEKAGDLKEATYVLKDLVPGDYYWQVVANDGNKGITESPVWNFKVIDEPVAPKLSSVITLSNYTKTSVTITSSVENNGGDEITERGIYWNTTGNAPEEGDGTKVTVNGQLGELSCELTGLEQIKYYVRIFASNNYGTTYSEPVAFVPHDYVFVEGGTFTMGFDGKSSPYDNEGPAHSVTLSDYSIGKYEVTIAQYIGFLNAIGCNADGTFNDDEHGLVPYIKMSDDDCPIEHNGAFFGYKASALYHADESSAVSYVYWYGANAYAKWLGGHLPTEAQWEYAAKGGSKSEGYYYSGGNDLDAVAWNKGNTPAGGSRKEIQLVGQKTANELGIYDMTGNVDEWCNDWYKEDYYATSPENDPQGPTESEATNIGYSGTILGKVVRGGACDGNVYGSDPEGYYTVTYRNKKTVIRDGDKSGAYAYYRHGFRVAK